MDAKYLVPEITAALQQKSLPTITLWNRQEGRPRTDNFDRAMKAEIRDALWMLTKQWQMGEFQGDDAGSPIMVKAHVDTSALRQYQPGSGGFQPMGDQMPLETLVEQKPLVMEQQGRIQHLDLRLQLGRRWLKLLGDAGMNAYTQDYKDNYGFTLPPLGEHASDFVYAHVDAWQQYAAVAGRAMDGYLLYAYLTDGAAHRASDGIALLNGTDAETLDNLGDEFKNWFSQLYQQPQPQEHAWQPPYLEYQFACAVNDEPENNTQYLSREYFHGAPDWYVFNRDIGKGVPPEDPLIPKGAFTFSMLPAPIVFDGMPDTRWWSFEDRKTNFAEVKPNTTDLAKLLLLEFSLVYANDWFIIPFRLPINSAARVTGLTVTNTFGETTWIDPSGYGEGQNWQRWEMFTLGDATQRSGPSELLLPALTVKTQEGPPQEEIHFIRDEMANMVWAIEAIVPSVTGYGKGGKETAEETLTYHKKLVAQLGFVPEDYPYQAAISYLSMTQVPEHWIPFQPVHIEGSNREIQLQRAKMLRILEGDTREPERIAPLTTLLREGLDQMTPLPYFIHEEEILRSGIVVTQQFQRTRWTGGQVYTWYGARKITGRGEGSSGLAFDQILPQASDSTEEAVGAGN
jgi:hypothetical protein